MSDERDDELLDELEHPTPSLAKPRRGRPKGSKKPANRPPTARFARRAEKSASTIAELLRIGKPDLDVEGLSFLQVVNRDVDAWGNFLAQIAEWVAPVGTVIDTFFGSALVVLLNMAPSFRAARRDLRARSVARRDARAQQQAEAEEAAAAEQEQQRVSETGVFAQVPQAPPAGVSREEWLANGGSG